MGLGPGWWKGKEGSPQSSWWVTCVDAGSPPLKDNDQGNVVSKKNWPFWGPAQWLLTFTFSDLSLFKRIFFVWWFLIYYFLSKIKYSSNITFSFFELFLIPCKHGFVDIVDWIWNLPCLLPRYRKCGDSFPCIILPVSFMGFLFLSKETSLVLSI